MLENSFTFITEPTYEQRSEVIIQLNTILLSEDFSNSEKMYDFLKYVVNETLDGNRLQLKQSVIAKDIYGRTENFDQRLDPIVRVQAAKVRLALEKYYVNYGANDLIKIEIPKGQYSPRFSYNSKTVLVDKETKSFKKPIVAVIPFSNLTGDNKNDYFARGFAEDLSTELSKFSNLSLVAFYSMHRLSSEDLDLSMLNQKLKTDYVITGSVRQIEPEFRFNIQICDSKSGQQVWAHRIVNTDNSGTLFSQIDVVIRKICSEIGGIYGVIQSKVAQTSSRSVNATFSAYDAVLKYLNYTKTLRADDYRQAREALEIIVNKNPNYSFALANLATLNLDAFAFGMTDDTSVLTDGHRYAQEAILADELSLDAHFSLAWSALIRGDTATSINSSLALINLNPSDTYYVGAGGWFLGLAGKLEEGISIIKSCKELNPNYPSWFYFLDFLFEFAQDNYSEALKIIHRINITDIFWGPLLKSACKNKLNKKSQANEEYQKAQELNPFFATNPDFYLNCLIKDEKLIDKLLQAIPC